MSHGATLDSGYYRFPTLSGEQIVFVSEDDLWTVATGGGIARRLSSGLGKVKAPALSPDGRWLAFNSTEEGHAEVFVMPAEGGEAHRLTYIGVETRVIGWNKNGEILFASNHQHGFSSLSDLYTIDRSSRRISRIPCGPATHIDFDEKDRAVIARRGGTDLAYWKRYRGGLAGEIWIDRKGDGEFTKLLRKPVNGARPYWIGERIYFISDEDGIGNVYSVDEAGGDLRRHTDSREYYVRGMAVHGSKIVYHAGGDLFLFDADGGGKPEKVPINYKSPRTQLNRRFVSAAPFLEDYELHPSEERAVISARGKSFSFALWKGPVMMHGEEGALRSRLGRFLNDGRRVVVVSDAGGEETLEIHDTQSGSPVEKLSGLDLGRTLEMKLSPVADEAVLVNHRSELIWVDLAQSRFRVLDRSQHSRIHGFNWSPDGRHVAYGCSENERTSAIRICEVESGQVHRVTRPILRDVRPFFDPAGEYLYFISYRDFDPVYDNLHFDLGFPRGCRPYLLTLRKDVLSPFSPEHAGRTKEKDKEGALVSEAKKRTDIDFDGIEDRILPLPVADGRYGSIAATREKVYFTRLPIKGSLRSHWSSREPEAEAQLEMLDLETEKIETVVNGITSFRMSQSGKHLIYRAGNSLRVIKTGEKPARESDDHRRGGWLDLHRAQIPVRPRAEWRQMYREAWRLQRDHFWTEDMSKVDWNLVHDRYLPLLERVGSRSEVSDVIWEMQGELGTSHAYEIGGDYRTAPRYEIGFLGVESEFDESESGYRLTRVLKGDLWDEGCSSPLARAGIGLTEGDVLLAIDGQPLTRDHRPEQSLIHRAGKEVAVTFRRKGTAHARTLSVKALRSEQRLRYREWVESNRSFVHQKSRGRIGYLHIPNMGPFGYAEFHRAFLTELDRDGIIVDVRFNGGGHVSQLVLEKLARKRIGYSKSRWYGLQPYPEESPAGPMVALTNEYAGSDGDIFSHSFKLMRLGPLVGKRTWGGVIGISPSHSLVDGGITTQPEFSFWFADVGWKVENYGTEPDVEVDFRPADYVAGRDPQLEAAIRLCEGRMKRQRPKRPNFDDLPDLSLPV
jgi:tricorn protease